MKRTRQTVYLQDCYNGEYNNIRIGDTIKIEYGYGHSETGKVYGKFATQWGKHLRVKIDNGNEVRWEQVSGIRNGQLGIGSYWTPDSQLRK